MFIPYNVTPFVGVWIETLSIVIPAGQVRSHPSWVCGLKQFYQILKHQVRCVTPFVGVWIETHETYYQYHKGYNVTPFVGVWIETAIFLL